MNYLVLQGYAAHLWSGMHTTASSLNFGKPAWLPYLFPWLLHLDQDGNDEKNQNDPGWNTDDRAVGPGDLVEEAPGSLL